MDEFSGSEEMRPFLHIIGTKDAEISFNFLIGLFSLSISLGMVGGREADIIFKKSCEFSCKGRCKLRATV